MLRVLGVAMRKMKRKTPTASLLRVVMIMRVATTLVLRPQAITLAMFPSEPSTPALRIPHSGLIPTGAEVGLVERPVSELGECFWNRSARPVGASRFLGEF